MNHPSFSSFWQARIVFLSLFLITILNADDYDRFIEQKYFKISPNKIYKAAVTYDHNKEWEAFVVYKTDGKKETLMSISRVINEPLEKVSFMFSEDSKYLLVKMKTMYEQKEKHLHVYTLGVRGAYECKNDLTLEKILNEDREQHFSNCLSNRIIQ